MHYGYRHNAMYTSFPLDVQEDNHICKQVKHVVFFTTSKGEFRVGLCCNYNIFHKPIALSFSHKTRC